MSLPDDLWIIIAHMVYDRDFMSPTILSTKMMLISKDYCNQFNNKSSEKLGIRWRGLCSLHLDEKKNEVIHLIKHLNGGGSVLTDFSLGSDMYDLLEKDMNSGLYMEHREEKPYTISIKIYDYSIKYKIIGIDDTYDIFWSDPKDLECLLRCVVEGKHWVRNEFGLTLIPIRDRNPKPNLPLISTQPKWI